MAGRKRKVKERRKTTGLSVLSLPFDFYLLDSTFIKLKVNALVFIGGRKWILKSPDLQQVQWGTSESLRVKK